MATWPARRAGVGGEYHGCFRAGDQGNTSKVRRRLCHWGWMLSGRKHATSVVIHPVMHDKNVIATLIADLNLHV